MREGCAEYVCGGGGGGGCQALGVGLGELEEALQNARWRRADGGLLGGGVTEGGGGD